MKRLLWSMFMERRCDKIAICLAIDISVIMSFISNNVTNNRDDWQRLFHPGMLMINIVLIGLLVYNIYALKVTKDLKEELKKKNLE